MTLGLETRQKTVDAILIRNDGGYTALCAAVPGAISQGDTVEEALVNIREAAELVIDVLSDAGGNPFDMSDQQFNMMLNEAKELWAECYLDDLGIDPDAEPVRVKELAMKAVIHDQRTDASIPLDVAILIAAIQVSF